MRLWRLIRKGQTALDGAGTLKHGGRYSPPGAPVVNFASEAGLAVLVALRYLPSDPVDAPDGYLLGRPKSMWFPNAYATPTVTMRSAPA
jgi:hypothetical protein